MSGLSSVDILEPGVDVLLRFVLCVAVALLQTAGEFGALALDYIEVVIGEFAPLLLHLTFELLPIPLYAIPVHRCAPLIGKSRRQHGDERNSSCDAIGRAESVRIFLKIASGNMFPDGTLSRRTARMA